MSSLGRSIAAVLLSAGAVASVSACAPEYGGHAGGGIQTVHSPNEVKNTADSFFEAVKEDAGQQEEKGDSTHLVNDVDEFEKNYEDSLSYLDTSEFEKMDAVSLVNNLSTAYSSAPELGIEVDQSQINISGDAAFIPESGVEITGAEDIKEDQPVGPGTLQMKYSGDGWLITGYDIEPSSPSKLKH